MTIRVSDGPPLVTVGDYVGMSYKDGVDGRRRRTGFNVSMYGKFGRCSARRTRSSTRSLAPNQQVEKGTHHSCWSYN